MVHPKDPSHANQSLSAQDQANGSNAINIALTIFFVLFAIAGMSTH